MFERNGNGVFSEVDPIITSVVTDTPFSYYTDGDRLTLDFGREQQFFLYEFDSRQLILTELDSKHQYVLYKVSK